MSEEKPEHLHQIKKAQNDKIVHLIKSKLTPMHKKPKFFPPILQPISPNVRQSRSTASGNYMYKELQICDKPVKVEREIDKTIKSMSLFKKVRSHIEEKKKVISEEEIQNARLKMPKISFSSYIQLFSRFQQVDPSRTSFDFNKFKRESLTLNVFDNIENLPVKENEKAMNETQICLMNAKFRKQLNHRKLIAIWKVKSQS